MTNFREILIKVYQQTNKFGIDNSFELTKFEAELAGDARKYYEKIQEELKK